MTYAELFAGIGGWSVGLQPCGWELKWQCECDPFCCAVLRKRFGVPIAPDIKQISGWIEQHPELSQVDAIVGSPPCPPFSVAGKKLGTSDARHLYPAFLESVRLLRPRYVLMEQVAGLLYDRRAFGEYIGGLESIGYCVLWHSIPACAVGADHARDRIWIIAHADGGEQTQRLHVRRTGWQQEPVSASADVDGEPGRSSRSIRGQQAGTEVEEIAGITSSDIDGQRLPKSTRQAGEIQVTSNTQGNLRRTPSRTERQGRVAAPLGGIDADIGGTRLQTSRQCGAPENTAGSLAFIPAPPRFPGREAYPELLRSIHGVPNRSHRIKSLGNAVVPALVYQIGQAINLIETTKDK